MSQPESFLWLLFSEDLCDSEIAEVTSQAEIDQLWDDTFTNSEYHQAVDSAEISVLWSDISNSQLMESVDEMGDVNFVGVWHFWSSIVCYHGSVWIFENCSSNSNKLQCSEGNNSTICEMCISSWGEDSCCHSASTLYHSCWTDQEICFTGLSPLQFGFCFPRESSWEITRKRIFTICSNETSV